MNCLYQQTNHKMYATKFWTNRKTSNSYVLRKFNRMAFYNSIYAMIRMLFFNKWSSYMHTDHPAWFRAPSIIQSPTSWLHQTFCHYILSLTNSSNSKWHPSYRSIFQFPHHPRRNIAKLDKANNLWFNPWLQIIKNDCLLQNQLLLLCNRFAIYSQVQISINIQFETK